MDGWVNLQLTYIMVSDSAKAKRYELGSSYTGIPQHPIANQIYTNEVDPKMPNFTGPLMAGRGVSKFNQ